MKGPAVDVIAVPWDSGRRGWRMGAGPLRLLERGVLERLHELGLEARAITIELPAGAVDGDAGNAFALDAEISRAVRHARAQRHFPLVLAGNCNSALGTVAGMGGGSGVIWFDAHGDFNTPQTSASGFLDGMSIAMLTGRCCTDETAVIPGFRAVGDEAVVIVGARDIDDGERALLDASGVRVIGVGTPTSEEVAAAVEAWPAAAIEAYVHVDLDVLDPAEAIVNEYAAAGGLTLPDLLNCVDAVATHVPIGAAAITALDPDADPDGRALAAAITVIEQIVARAESGRAA